ncbi:MAG: DNA/RNA non-specific endonuclease [Spirochaetia bacterium]
MRRLWSVIAVLSVLAPQIARLNRGPWRSLENAVRRLVTHLGSAYVIAGPYYDNSEEPMPLLPGADESHRVPNGYWMIVYSDDAESPEVCAFSVPQRLPDSYTAEQFITTVDAVEALTGLDFLSLLDDETEAAVESMPGDEWFAVW